MSEQSPESANQSLNISDSVLDTVQIGGIAGRDLNLTQVQGGVGSINVFGTVQVAQQAPLTIASSLSREEYEWRKVLLSKVKQFWIDGVLTKSLHTQALIELGLEDRRDYVPNPTADVEEFASEDRKVLPAGSSATEIFEAIGAGRTLLILGEPGSGKTVTLLKLAESLIKRTENNLSQPLPVLINLSSWAKKREAIDDWLAQEIYETYQVAKSLGKSWINDEQLILLLDGLDEVIIKHRNACVRALNYFIQTHGRTEIVVCSRLRDYEALTEQLSLRSALYVQPLTQAQINQYLKIAGPKLTSLKTLLNQSPEIREFTSSPLILSIMSLAYQEGSVDDLQGITAADVFYDHLFNTYIDRMFARRGTTQQYSREHTIHWLIWMAQRMSQESQTVFLIERMTASLLQTKRQRIQYRLESVVVSGLIFGGSFGLIVGVIFGLHHGLNNGLFEGVIAAVVGFFVIALMNGSFVGLIVGCSSGNIKTVETLKWSWQTAKSNSLVGLNIGLFYGYGFGFLIGSIYGVNQMLAQGLVAGLMQGLRGGLFLGAFIGILSTFLQGLIGFLVGGFNGPAMQRTFSPNQGIWKSVRNASTTGLIAGLVGGLISILLFGVLNGIGQGLYYGMVGSLIGGGIACLQHLTLRLKLYRMGYVPWNYARFLDYAAERLFLQKVGGGYIFVHRMLLEHFAAMELEKT